MTRIWMLLAAAALTTLGCEVPNPRYCDGDTRTCTDPQRPYCNVPARQCQPAPDGGGADAGPLTDGGGAESGPQADGGGADGGQDGADAADGPPVQDAGTEAAGGDAQRDAPPADASADAAAQDATPDGPAAAPDATGDAAPCTATSCPDSLPICGAGGACRACAGHGECATRDAAKPVCILQQCRPSVCGDGYTDAARGEVCDDGNTDNSDGCDPTCRWTGTVTTIAGKAKGTGYCDDTGLNARVVPRYATATGTTVYFTDRDTVRKMTLPSYAVTRVAGSPLEDGAADGSAAQARFAAPTGIASDGTFLYVADAGNYTIRRVLIADGSTATIAGAAGQSGTVDNASSGLNARFRQLAGLAWFKDATTNILYVLDGCAIRKVNLNVTNFPVSTLTGAATDCGWADGSLASARFAAPQGIVVSAGGEIYVADTGNHVIRWIYSTGSQVTTLAGTQGQVGSIDGTAGAARFNAPVGITRSPSANALFVTDRDNFTVRKVEVVGGAVTTLAGMAGAKATVDGSGTAARFRNLGGLAAGGSQFGDDLVLADGETFRRMTLVGSITTVAGVPGSGEMPVSADGTGTLARFDYPWGMTATSDGLVLSDAGGCVLRHLALGDFAVTTIAGTPDHCTMSDGTGAAGGFLNPHGLLAHASSIYVGDMAAIREFFPASGSVATRAGSAAGGSQDGNGGAAGFMAASRMASDGSYLYVSDNGTLRRVTIGAPWTVTTILGQPGLLGGVDGTGSSARLGVHLGLLVIGSMLYVADPVAQALRTVDLASQPYTISTVAGVLGSPGTQDGIGAAARFELPWSLAWGGASLFVVDLGHIRQVDLATMRVTTLVGRRDCLAAIDGDHVGAAFNVTQDLAYSTITGRLYATDAAENVVREIR